MLVYQVEDILESGYDDADVQSVANEAQHLADKTEVNIYVMKGESRLVVAVPEMTTAQILRAQIDAVLED